MMFLQHWPEFRRRCEVKAVRGFHEYGDRSYSREPMELLNEIQEELVDTAVWASILFARLDELKKKIMEVKDGKETSHESQLATT